MPIPWSFFVSLYREFQPMDIGIIPRKLTAREAENRRAYESHILQNTINAGIAVSDAHTKATYNTVTKL